MKMAGDLSCAAKRKAKERSSEYINCRIDKAIDEKQDAVQMTTTRKTTRNGLRVFKIVILGDGGVGKSGKNHMHAPTYMFLCMCSRAYRM